MIPLVLRENDVKAILDGRKTQIRRPVLRPGDVPGNYLLKDHPFGYLDKIWWEHPTFAHIGKAQNCPLGSVGQELWVREAWRIGAWNTETENIAVDYKADSVWRREWLNAGLSFDNYVLESIEDAKKAGLQPNEDGRYQWKPGESPCRWRSPLFMPKWASQLKLRVTQVRVERLQNMSEEDAYSEGAELYPLFDGEVKDYKTYLNAFRDMWNSRAKNGTLWSCNPWVWAVSFEVKG